MGLSGLVFVHLANAVFHFATLEEYYVGGLFLPIGNAISDGSLIYYIVMLIPAFFGNEIFRHECFSKNHFYEGSPSIVVIHLMLTFVGLVQTSTIVMSIYNILKHK